MNSATTSAAIGGGPSSSSGADSASPFNLVGPWPPSCPTTASVSSNGSKVGHVGSPNGPTVSAASDAIQQLQQLVTNEPTVRANQTANIGGSPANPLTNYDAAFSTLHQQMLIQQQQQQQTWSQCYPVVSGMPWNTNSWAVGPYGQKKGRQTYQRYQTAYLEERFRQNQYVSKKQREELMKSTQLKDRQIKIWFQNRRMKAKKETKRQEEPADASPEAKTIGMNSSTPYSQPPAPPGHSSASAVIDNTMPSAVMDEDMKKSNGFTAGIMSQMTATTPMWNNSALSTEQMSQWMNYPQQAVYPQSMYYNPYGFPPNPMHF